MGSSEWTKVVVDGYWNTALDMANSNKVFEISVVHMAFRESVYNNEHYKSMYGTMKASCGMNWMKCGDEVLMHATKKMYSKLSVDIHMDSIVCIFNQEDIEKFKELPYKDMMKAIYADERYKNRMSKTKAGANGINWKFDESLFKLYKHYQNKCKKQTNPIGIWPKNKNYGAQYVKKCNAFTKRGTRCTIGTCTQSTTLCANHYINGTSLYGVCHVDTLI